jgi:hypothetical protein
MLVEPAKGFEIDAAACVRNGLFEPIERLFKPVARSSSAPVLP